jgi:peptidoglycan/LPS O-acetylase OafA/YrhL
LASLGSQSDPAQSRHLRWACFGHVPAEKLRIYTWLCADNLAAGSLLAVLLRTSVSQRLVALISGAATLLGLVLAGIGGWYSVANQEHLAGAVFTDTVLSLVFSGTLLLFLLVGSSRPWFVRSRVLQFFGYISYSLYLFQLLIAGVYDRFAFQFLPNLQPSSERFDLAVFRFVMTFALAIGLAYLSRRYFEGSFLRLKSRFSTGSKNVEEKQTLAVLSRS